MKKCCLNCAFCVRCMQYQNTTNKTLLNNEERKLALNNNFDFLGKEKRNQEEWEKQYQEKYELLRQGHYNIKGPDLLEILQRENELANNGRPFSLNKFFGMTNHPNAPIEDYLTCWHHFWEFYKSNDKRLPELNIKNTCPLFYAYNQKGNKTFEACEKYREIQENKKNSFITNLWVILGIVVSIIIAIFKK